MITMPYVNFAELSKERDDNHVEDNLPSTLYKNGDKITIKLKDGKVLSGTFNGYWGEDNDDGLFIDDYAISDSMIADIIRNDVDNQINEVLGLAGVQLDETIILDPEENKKWQNSPKGQLIQKQPIQNVGQLIELLKTLPSDAPIAGGDRYREFEYACEVYLVREYNKTYVGFLSKNW